MKKAVCGRSVCDKLYFVTILARVNNTEFEFSSPFFPSLAIERLFFLFLQNSICLEAEDAVVVEEADEEVDGEDSVEAQAMHHPWDLHSPISKTCQGRELHYILWVISVLFPNSEN